MVAVAAVLLALAVVVFTVQASIMSAVLTHGSTAPHVLSSPRALLPSAVVAGLSAVVIAVSGLA
ncbi:hypothetical protein [Herbiconiux liukaitaii]|uniref:hypothetical protein n=1 Tax=Herbiconiux liukaitaii TaxID=3342799 RepID=UPI0035BAB8B6